MERQEHGTAGSQDDVVRIGGELLAPYLHTLGIAITRVVDAQAVAKDALQALGDLHRKGYLWKEVEHLLALSEGL